jgi:hypothetical protein
VKLVRDRRCFTCANTGCGEKGNIVARVLLLVTGISHVAKGAATVYWHGARGDVVLEVLLLCTGTGQGQDECRGGSTATVYGHWAGGRMGVVAGVLLLCTSAGYGAREGVVAMVLLLSWDRASGKPEKLLRFHFIKIYSFPLSYNI